MKPCVRYLPQAIGSSLTHRNRPHVCWRTQATPPEVSWTYSNDAEYMSVLADAKAEDIRFLQSPEARAHDDFDTDLADEAPEIIEALIDSRESGRRFPVTPSPIRVEPPRPVPIKRSRGPDHIQDQWDH